MKIVTTELLRQISEQAAALPRLRKNHNLHPGDDSCCHRLLNAIEPGSYIPPHRHLDAEKDEAFILMSGCLGIITFTDNGEVSETVVLSRESGILAADIPFGIYHTAVSLEPGTVFYEAKAGPYRPLSVDDKATWAPAADEAGKCAYLERLRELFAV
jgi:cupin fold WbuC family metalloprotein